MGPFMDMISSGCVTVQLGGKDRGSGPAGRLELVRRLGCSRSSSHKGSGFQGPSEGLEWLLTPNPGFMPLGAEFWHHLVWAVGLWLKGG